MVFKLKVNRYFVYSVVKSHQLILRHFLGDSIPTPVPLPEENLKALAEFEAAYATGEIYNRNIF